MKNTNVIKDIEKLIKFVIDHADCDSCPFSEECRAWENETTSSDDCYEFFDIKFNFEEGNNER